MQAALRKARITVEDYLAGEEAANVRHEYIAGITYCMAGGTTDHHQIAFNIAVAARSHLKGKPCRVFLFDVKLRLSILSEDVFYYPDVMVGCDPRDTHKLYLCYPKLVVEVASESTQRVDLAEKRVAYQSIETLEDYVLVAQNKMEVTLFRRSNGWRPEQLNKAEQTLTLHSLGLQLPLATIYEGVLAS